MITEYELMQLSGKNNIEFVDDDEYTGWRDSDFDDGYDWDYYWSELHGKQMLHDLYDCEEMAYWWHEQVKDFGEDNIWD